MTMLKISHYIDNTRVLGPFIRSALWVHGCNRSCKGCIAQEMNTQVPKNYDIEELAKFFLEVESAEGITISGGEPFLQAEALYELIRQIRECRDYGVIVYTGNTYEELLVSDDSWVHKLLSQTDILIDGRYIEELDDGIPYRGSSNQKIILLSDRYRDSYEDYYLKGTKRNIEIKVTGKNVYLAGVPSKNGLEVWKTFKKKAGGDNDAV